MANIEISFEMKASVNGRFWIDRAEWDGLTPDQRKAKIDEVIDATNATFDRNELDVGPGWVYVHAADIDGEPGCYDPEAEGRA